MEFIYIFGIPCKWLRSWIYGDIMNRYTMVRAGKVDCKTSGCCLYLKSKYMKQWSLLLYEGGGYV